LQAGHGAFTTQNRGALPYSWRRGRTVFRQPFWTANLTIADYTLMWIVGPGSFPVPDPLCRLETFAFPDWRDTPEARPDVSGIEIRGRKPFSFNLVAPMRI
jgi:hypothetical protein